MASHVNLTRDRDSLVTCLKAHSNASERSPAALSSFHSFGLNVRSRGTVSLIHATNIKGDEGRFRSILKPQIFNSL